MKIIRLLILSVVLLVSKVNAQKLNFDISQNAWLEDVKFLKKQVEKTVPLYEIAERQKAFDSIYNIIMDNDIGHLKEDKIWALQYLLNTLEDEGCNVPFFQTGLDLEILPIKTYWFDDGLYVLDASENYSSYIGKEIVKINQNSIDKVFEALQNVVNADNSYYKKHLFQAYGFMPLVLKTMGLGTHDESIELEFADGKMAKFNSSSINDYVKLSRDLPNDSKFQYNGSTHNGEEGESFGGFVDRIEDQIKDGKANKIILDLRYGGGGNGFKLKKLTDLLRESQINERGKLFVLTSRATRGTLLELASILRLNTKAVILGQPTAEDPNTVGDTKYITLPNLGLNVSLTHTLWPTSWEQDNKVYLSPDETIRFAFSEYKAKKDPWIDAVIGYENSTQRTAVSEDIQTKLQGNYSINGRKVSIKAENGRLFINMNRKMKSFFEIHTELYLKSKDGS